MYSRWRITPGERYAVAAAALELSTLSPVSGEKKYSRDGSTVSVSRSPTFAFVRGSTRAENIAVSSSSASSEPLSSRSSERASSTTTAFAPSRPEEHVGVGADALEHLDLDVERRQPVAGERGVLEGLGPDPDDHRSPARGAALGSSGSDIEPIRIVSPSTVALDEVHRGRADERRDEEVRGLVVEARRNVDLLNAAVAHHRDTVAERHRLDLVVRDVDRRRADPAVKLLQRGAHRHAQLRVEVRERLVHQERRRLADDRAAHGDALHLPAGERARPAVEQPVEAEQLRGLLDAALDLRLLQLAHPQRVAEVLAHGHVRVERVVLEHHREVALRGLLLRHVAAVDQDAARRDALEPADRAEQRRLPAARTGRRAP